MEIRYGDIVIDEESKDVYIIHLDNKHKLVDNDKDKVIRMLILQMLTDIGPYLSGIYKIDNNIYFINDHNKVYHIEPLDNQDKIFNDKMEI